mmetsp:Transcript_5121/g.11191  ORF Transcript_5121/g.11191 Transcript_5121/m.11191 type:complete len:208 (+) Transcript_5121:375-998(+)
MGAAVVTLTRFAVNSFSLRPTCNEYSNSSPTFNVELPSTSAPCTNAFPDSPVPGSTCSTKPYKPSDLVLVTLPTKRMISTLHADSTKVRLSVRTQNCTKSPTCGLRLGSTSAARLNAYSFLGDSSIIPLGGGPRPSSLPGKPLTKSNFALQTPRQILSSTVSNTALPLGAKQIPTATVFPDRGSSEMRKLTSCPTRSVSGSSDNSLK